MGINFKEMNVFDTFNEKLNGKRNDGKYSL